MNVLEWEESCKIRVRGWTIPPAGDFVQPPIILHVVCQTGRSTLPSIPTACDHVYKSSGNKKRGRPEREVGPPDRSSGREMTGVWRLSRISSWSAMAAERGLSHVALPESEELWIL